MDCTDKMKNACAGGAHAVNKMNLVKLGDPGGKAGDSVVSMEVKNI